MATRSYDSAITTCRRVGNTYNLLSFVLPTSSPAGLRVPFRPGQVEWTIRRLQKIPNFLCMPFAYATFPESERRCSHANVTIARAPRSDSQHDRRPGAYPTGFA